MTAVNRKLQGPILNSGRSITPVLISQKKPVKSRRFDDKTKTLVHLSATGSASTGVTPTERHMQYY